MSRIYKPTEPKKPVPPEKQIVVTKQDRILGYDGETYPLRSLQGYGPDAELRLEIDHGYYDDHTINLYVQEKQTIINPRFAKQWERYEKQLKAYQEKFKKYSESLAKYEAQETANALLSRTEKEVKERKLYEKLKAKYAK